MMEEKMENLKNKIQCASLMQEFADSKIADSLMKSILKLFFGLICILFSMSLPFIYILLHAFKIISD